MLLDAYAYRSRWRTAPPMEKMMVISTGFMISLISHHLEIVWGLFFLLMTVNVFLHGHSVRLYPRLMIVPLMFIVPSSFVLMITLGDPESLNDIVVSFPLYSNTAVSITSSGIGLGVLILGKALSAYAALLMLVLSTPVLELTTFLEKCRVPGLFIELMLLTYRMIGILIETQEVIYRAQVSRCGWSDFFKAMRSASLLIYNLFSRSLFYTHRLGMALEARGYKGTLRVLQPDQVPFSVKRMVFTGIWCFILMVAASWMEWGHDH